MEYKIIDWAYNRMFPNKTFKTSQDAFDFLLNELEEEEQAKYKNAVNKKVQAFLAQQNPKTKAKGEELERQVDTAIDKEIGIPQGTEQKDDSFNSLDIPKYGNIIELALKEYKKVPIEEFNDEAKLVVALTHRYFDNRALTEQFDPKKIFLGTLGRKILRHS